MDYKIAGLAVEQFTPLFNLHDDALAKRGVVRCVANASHAFPCRVTLADRVSARPQRHTRLLRLQDHLRERPRLT